MLFRQRRPRTRPTARPRLEELEPRRQPAAHLTAGPDVNLGHIAADQSETTLAIDPTHPDHLFAASNMDSQQNGLYVSFSTDGGATWTARVMGVPGDTADPGVPVPFTDPKCAFDRFGNLFLTYIDNNNSVVLVRSVDGGRTFSPLATLATGSVDQPSVATGPGGAAAAGSVWVTYQDGAGRIAARGAPVTGLGQAGAFVPAQTAPGSLDGNFGGIAVGPQGQVLVSYQKPPPVGSGPDTVFVNTDADGLGPGGFGAAVAVTTTNVAGFDASVPAESARSIDAKATPAWDRSGGAHNGRVYLVYTDAPSAASANTDIFLRFSDDGGATWSARVRVNDDAGSASQFWPWPAVDQATGDVGVSWYDARNDHGDHGPGDTDGVPNDDVEVFAAVSTDGGATFLPNVQVASGPSNAATRAADDPQQFGDYTGMDFLNGRLYPVWADNSGTLPGNTDLPTFDIATARVTLSAGPVLTGLAVTPGPVAEGTAVSLSGTFTDPDQTQAHTVTVDWGDGSAADTLSLAAGVTGFGPAAHVYAEEQAAPSTVTVTVADSAGDVSAPMTAQVTVTDAPLAVTAGPVQATEGTPFAGPVATFTDAGGPEAPGSYLATIDWGDGTAPTDGTVALAGGTLTVSGSHVYAEESPAGGHALKVTVQDEGGATASDTGTADVAEAPLTGSGAALTGVEGVALTDVVVADFTHGTGTEPAGDFSAAIDWGDGTTSPGTVVPSGGAYHVLGSHVYAEGSPAGGYTLKVTVQEDGGATASITGTADVAEAPLTASGVALAGVPGVALTGVPVADFTHGTGTEPAGDFSAAIDWGDGTTSPGMVVLSGGTYRVLGSHTYGGAGHFTVTVTLREDAPGAAPTTVTAAADIASPPLVGSGAALTLFEGDASTVAVAAFTHGANVDPPGAFVATILWGDGTATAGSVVPTAGGYAVLGSHAYAEEGAYPLTVGISDGVQQVALGGTVRVVEPGATPGQRFVSEAFFDLFGRPADAGTLSRLGAKVDRGATRLALKALLTPSAIRQLRAQLFGGRGAHVPTTSLIGAYVQHFLDRPAQPQDVAALKRKLRAAGDLGVLQGLLGSAEYFARVAP
jgi:hypothetical protein